MSRFAESISRLIDELKRLPSAGITSTQRLAFHVLRSIKKFLEPLGTAVLQTGVTKSGYFGRTRSVLTIV